LRIANLGNGEVCDHLPDDLREISQQVEMAQLEKLRSRRGRGSVVWVRPVPWRIGYAMWIVAAIGFMVGSLIGLLKIMSM
jgi:hypothetical protein